MPGRSSSSWLASSLPFMCGMIMSVTTVSMAPSMGVQCRNCLRAAGRHQYAVSATIERDANHPAAPRQPHPSRGPHLSLVEPGSLRLVQQISVLQLAPPAGAGLRDCRMLKQITRQRARRAVGVPSSKENQHLTARYRRFRAVSGELQDGLDLLTRDAEFLHQFIDAHVLKVLEHRRNGSPGSPENPCSADLARDAFHGGHGDQSRVAVAISCTPPLRLRQTARLHAMSPNTSSMRLWSLATGSFGSSVSSSSL
jgi:hypothetical protein